MKWKLIIIMLLFLIPTVTAYTQIQYSVDNATDWRDVANVNRNSTILESLDNGISEDTMYYFRLRNHYDNGISSWVYTSAKTDDAVGDMIFFTIAIIYLFITTLIVIGLVRTELLWLRVVLSLTLTFMLMTILRLAAWFVEIKEPTETSLIQTLNFYYSIGVRGFYFLLAGTMIFLVIYIVNSIRERPSKRRKKEWEDWGKDGWE